MLARQKQVIESFGRVRAFIETHPATGQPGFESAKAALDEALSRLREYASVQLSGRDLSRAELRRRDQLVERVRDRHMRKIVTIARGQIEPNSDVRLPAALRMPRGSLSVTKVLQACDAMIEAARQFEAVFIANGLPADFLEQFQQARDDLERAVGIRATLIGAHVGARKGLHVQLRRGRRAVDRIDAVVRATYEGEEAILTTWRNAKRVQKRPGGPGAPGAPTTPVGPAGPIALAVAA